MIDPMKSNRFLRILMGSALIALLFNACSETGLMGPEGPIGPAGPTGPAGAAGAVGSAGKDGSIIYSGNGAPASTLGNSGDYYLDKSTGNLYGPKTAAGWGTPVTLIGAKGADGTNGRDGTNGKDGSNGKDGKDGTNGSITFSGNGAPSSIMGQTGDYYLDKTNYLLYGPKVDADWGVPILLRGAAGAQGPMGPAGADGTIFYSGETAPDPALGKVGDFYISRLPIMLYGPKHATFGWGVGTNLKGADGANGTNGNTILNGIGIPSNSLGVSGDFYINISNYDMYGPKTAAGWGAPTSLKGADGSGGGSAGLLFETPDEATFSWGYEPSYYNDRSKLMMHRNGVYNDSTSVFQVPASGLAAAQTSLMLVYMRDAVNGWKQVVESDTTIYGFYSRSRIVSTGASARIIERINGVAIAPNIDKVRLVLVPYTVGGTISGTRDRAPLIPLNEVLRQLNRTEKDFKKL